MNNRKKIWGKLTNEWKPNNLEELVKDCSLDNLSAEIDSIYNGNQKGRIVVDMR